jgi:hypothetical protein
MSADTETVTLWRPTGPEELALVEASGWRSWPPRLPDQPIFYPVLNQEYATSPAPHTVRVFSRDGQYLATGGNAVRLWDAIHSREVGGARTGGVDIAFGVDVILATFASNSSTLLLLAAGSILTTRT